jgi:hypothetical protein
MTQPTSFDGTTLAGTTWVAEEKDVPFPFGSSGQSMDIKGTLKFTSDTEGTAIAEVTKWNGTWNDEMKEKVKGMMDGENGPFTYTYDADAKTGSYTRTKTDFMAEESETVVTTFVADVEKKTLTATELDDDKNPEITVYKLR